MTSEERLRARAIVSEWCWQPESWHRRSVVRFYESAPIQPDVLQLVIDYLKDEEANCVFLLNKKFDLGETWKAMDAWFSTSPSDKWAGTESTKVRVYQSLKPKSDSDGFIVEDGCKYRVTHEFHWDVAEVPELPGSTSGVQYALQGVTRDRETGLYSCVVEKRETVQQDVAEYVSGVTIFERKKIEQHIGVRQERVDATGKQASAGGGVLVERRITKNPDCTSDVDNETTEERPVQDAVVRVEKTLEGIIRTRKHVNQSEPATLNPERPGSSVQNEKKPAGTFDQTIVEADETPLGVKGRECSRSIYEHVDVQVENVPDDPGEQHGTAGGGTRTEIISSMTRYGTWDKKQITYVEQPVQESVKEYRKTISGTVVTTTDSNQVFPLGSGGMKVGESRRSERTRGGLWNNTRSGVDAIGAGLIRKSCDRTSVVHSDEQTNNVTDRPSSIEQTAEVNKRRTKVVRMTEGGTWDETEQVTTYEPKVKIEQWNDDFSSHTHCEYRNQPSPLKPAGGERVSCSFHMNDHGSYDGSYTVTNARDVAAGGGRIWQQTAKLSQRVYWAKPGGKLVYRLFKATAHYVDGAKEAVIDFVKNGDSCTVCGWKSGYDLMGRDFAFGVKYEDIVVGKEFEVK